MNSIINKYRKLMKLLQRSSKLSELQARLNKYPYLSRNNLPGYPDSIVFQFLNKTKKYPEKKSNPNLYHWYILMRQFAPFTISKWIEDKIYYDEDDHLIDFFIQLYSNQDEKRTPFKVISTSNTHPHHNISAKVLHKNLVNIEYIISINFKQRNESKLQILNRILHPYDVEVSEINQTGQININCKSQSSKHQEIANLVTKTIQYEYLQLKRQKRRIKTIHKHRF